MKFTFYKEDVVMHGPVEVGEATTAEEAAKEFFKNGAPDYPVIVAADNGDRYSYDSREHPAVATNNSVESPPVSEEQAAADAQAQRIAEELAAQQAEENKQS